MSHDRFREIVFQILFSQLHLTCVVLSIQAIQRGRRWDGLHGFNVLLSTLATVYHLNRLRRVVLGQPLPPGV